MSPLFFSDFAPAGSVEMRQGWDRIPARVGRANILSRRFGKFSGEAVVAASRAGRRDRAFSGM